ncbi:MAG: diguanylate cyclase [Rhodospirillaceae bacterium]|nr:diguanylate cyclase [Rhodospirillales bacterium]
MQVEKTREIVRLFERAAAEHLAWLMRVHSALMFPGTVEMPACAPDAPLTLLSAFACGEAEELAALVRLRGIMHGQAQELLGKAACQGCIDPADYQAFMAAVDGYSREARRVENHFRRLLVETDPLTGVHNRQGMTRDLRREWTRSLRTGQPVCVALADLDHFKVVNDTWGHAAGDRVLCAAARFFQRRLRPYDTVYRYGGEEFLFILPNTDADTAAKVLDRLRGTMARMPVVAEGGERIPVTCSIGVAQMVPGRSVHEAVGASDRALYAAKNAGRNRVEIAESADPAPPPEAIAARLHPIRGAVRH